MRTNRVLLPGQWIMLRRVPLPEPDRLWRPPARGRAPRIDESWALALCVASAAILLLAAYGAIDMAMHIAGGR